MKLVQDYFNNTVDYLSFMVIYGSGIGKAEALRITEDLYENKEAAQAWAKWIINNTDGEDLTNREINILYENMTGEVLFPELENMVIDPIYFESYAVADDAEEAKEAKEVEETEEEEITTETAEPKVFEVGGEIKCNVEYSACYFTPMNEVVVKRTKCFVWFKSANSTDEPEKRKIKVDANGNEYVEYYVSAMTGTWRWEPV